jgi:hypothetical protein
MVTLMMVMMVMMGMMYAMAIDQNQSKGIGHD